MLLAKPRGYCAGVDRAVQTVEEALKLYGAPIYVRKQIVHNKHVVQTLEAKGAIFVEENEEVPEGATVIFSAHGVAPEVYEQARARSLKAIDATCPLVTKVHQEARRFAAEDYDILLIGHEGHEEVIGTAGEAPAHIQLVDGPDGRRQGHRARPEQGRLALPDHPVGGRDAGDGGPAQVSAAAAPVAAQRRHLLRHLQPAARGEGDRPRLRRGDRRRLAELVQLGAPGRGGPGRRRPRRSPGRLRRTRSTTPGWPAPPPSASPPAPACPTSWSTQVLAHLAERGFTDVEEITTANERLTFSLPQELKRDMKAAARPPAADRPPGTDRPRAVRPIRV